MATKNAVFMRLVAFCKRLYKLKKYEETFQIDIRGDFKGGFLFILIASMMKEYQKRQQVGEDI